MQELKALGFKILVLSFLFHGPFAWASETPPSAQLATSCKNLLMSNPLSHIEVPPTEKISEELSVSIRPDPNHPAEFFLLTRIGSSWHSSYAPDGRNPQRDPRTPIMIFGEKLAKEFGLEMLSSNQMRAPRVSRFNQGIDRLNHRLLEKELKGIEWRLHDTELAIPISDLEYLRLTSIKRIPIASDGFYYIHDLSFHISFIFFPARLTDYLTSQSAAFLDFLNRVEGISSGQPPAIQQLIGQANQRALSTFIRSLDRISGNLNVAAESRYGRPKIFMRDSEFFEQGLESIYITSFNFLLNRWKDELSKQLDLAFNQNIQAEFSEMKVKINKFADQFLSESEPLAREGLSITHEEFVLEMDQRTLELRQLVEN